MTYLKKHTFSWIIQLIQLRLKFALQGIDDKIVKVSGDKMCDSPNSTSADDA